MLSLVDGLISSWRLHHGTAIPPAEPIDLWKGASRSISISNRWGPAIPYPPVDHGDGSQNYGYVQIKGNIEALERVPETIGWPEITAFLGAVNATGSPIESVSCEKGFSPIHDHEAITVRLGSYFDVVFTNAALNYAPENALELAGFLQQTVQGCEVWWSELNINLQPLRGVGGAPVPWGLELQISCCGRAEDEARKYWGETLRHLTKAITTLPQDFRFAGIQVLVYADKH